MQRGRKEKRGREVVWLDKWRVRREEKGRRRRREKKRKKKKKEEKMEKKRKRGTGGRERRRRKKKWGRMGWPDREGGQKNHGFDAIEIVSWV